MSRYKKALLIISPSIKKGLIAFIFSGICLVGYGQSVDSLKSEHKDSSLKEYHFSGTINATNNGMSFIPTFSLGKPATILSLSFGDKRLTMDPEFRFSLDGKPWSFLFWMRYKLINKGKFRLNIGGHPSFTFKTISAVVNGNTINLIQVQRFLASEIVPNYIISKNVSVGAYYLYSRGLDVNQTLNTNFVTLNANISNINLPYDFTLKIVPQFYYLKMDRNDGYYFSSTITVANKKSPFTLSTLNNKVINTNIINSKNFDWNITLAYTFNHKVYKH